jgi:Spy/CpxP family protein refolding chaperone
MRSCIKAVLLGIITMTMLGGTVWSQPKEKEGPPPGPEPGTVLPPFVSDRLNLTMAQQQKIATLEKDVKARLKKILSEQQLMQFQAAMQKGPGDMPMGKGPGDMQPKGGPNGMPPKGGPGMGPPGFLIPPFVRDKLQMTPAQQQQITALDQYATRGVMGILTTAQRKQLPEILKAGPPKMPKKD